MITMGLIKSEEGLSLALTRVEHLMNLDSISDEEAEELELLAVLIENYEDKHYPMEDPSPSSLLKHLMEQQGTDFSELSGLLGSQVLDRLLESDDWTWMSLSQLYELAQVMHVSPCLFVSEAWGTIPSNLGDSTIEPSLELA